MKNFVRKYGFSLPGNSAMQGLFRGLYRYSLWSMNIGLGSSVEDSGERYALRRFRETLRSGPKAVVFDVGANHGEFTKAVNEEIGADAHIYAFEPSKKTFQILNQNVAKIPHLTLTNVGLGHQQEEVTLYSDKEGSGVASVYDRNNMATELRLTETITLSTLDLFCSQNGIGYIDYLKMDVEGHEFSVLQGATEMLANDAIGWIQFEFGGCNIDSRTYFRDFYNLLSPKFEIYRLLRNGFARIEHYHETQEVFSTTNFVCISKAGRKVS